MSDPGTRLFVGVDWATEAHQVCLLDPGGKVVEERSVVHSGTGLGELVERLLYWAGGSPDSVAVAIEVPHGAVVDTLLEHGFQLYSLNPKQLDRFRDRFTVAGTPDECAEKLRRMFARLPEVTGVRVKLPRPVGTASFDDFAADLRGMAEVIERLPSVSPTAISA